MNRPLLLALSVTVYACGSSNDPGGLGGAPPSSRSSGSSSSVAHSSGSSSSQSSILGSGGSSATSSGNTTSWPTVTFSGDCTSDSQCPAAIPHCDLGTGLCIPDLCKNGALDTGETDKDCGGAACPKCVNGKKCLQSNDCQSNYCDATTKLCAIDPCKNGTKDGNETDKDCGGGTCAKCDNTLGCKADTDCTSNFCDTTSHCAADSCQDNTKNNNESDVDCGGTALTGTTHACPKCGSGKACKAGTDCGSGTCLSTNVCDGPCSGICTVAAGDTHVLTGGWNSPAVGTAARCFELLTGTKTYGGGIWNLGSRTISINGTAVTDMNAGLASGPTKGGYCIALGAGQADTGFGLW